MPQNDLLDKLNAIGGNTIMGSLANVNANLQEQVENMKENNDTVTETAIDKITASVLANNIKKHPIVKDHKIGRNEPCPCGSGKKYKNCCLNSGEYETYTRI